MRSRSCGRRRATPPPIWSSAKPVNGKSVAGAEAHVRVASFGTGAVAALRQAFATLQKDGARGAVIDLRGTADGALDEGVAAARLFIKSGTIAIKAGRRPIRPPSPPVPATARSRCRWCC